MYWRGNILVYTTNRQSITWNTSWSVLSIPLNSFHLAHLFLWSLLNCLGLRGKTWNVIGRALGPLHSNGPIAFGTSWNIKILAAPVCVELNKRKCKCVAGTSICFAAAAFSVIFSFPVCLLLWRAASSKLKGSWFIKPSGLGDMDKLRFQSCHVSRPAECVGWAICTEFCTKRIREKILRFIFFVLVFVILWSQHFKHFCPTIAEYILSDTAGGLNCSVFFFFVVLFLRGFCSV